MRGHLWLYVCLLLSGATGAPLVCTECLNNGTLITSRPCACGCSDGWAPPRCAALLTGTSSLALSFAMPRSDFMSQSFSEAVRASTLQVSAKTTGVFTFSRLVGVSNVAVSVTSSTDSFAAIFTVANPFVQPLLLLESDAPTAVARLALTRSATNPAADACAARIVRAALSWCAATWKPIATTNATANSQTNAMKGRLARSAGAAATGATGIAASDTDHPSATPRIAVRIPENAQS